MQQRGARPPLRQQKTLDAEPKSCSVLFQIERINPGPSQTSNCKDQVESHGLEKILLGNNQKRVRSTKRSGTSPELACGQSGTNR